MYKGTVTYKEFNHIQKLEVKLDCITKLLEIMARFDDLDVVEIHIIKET
jgi:hypothetical protein